MRQLMKNPQQGFTLVEAIMVIVITGIIAGMVAVFIRQPVEAYLDTARRAALTDMADTAARRMARDLQGALPNSVRVDGTGRFLEFAPIRDAGRYRAEIGTAPLVDDPLDFTNAAETSFDVLGPPVTVLAGDSLVVYNLGIAPADVYALAPNNRRTATAGAGLSKVTFTATAAALPFASPGSRFQIVRPPVSYVCDPLPGGTGTLWRYSGYAFQPNQPSSLATLNGYVGITAAPLANNVTACSFTYGPGPLQHNGLVSISLTLTLSGESVTLQHQVNVDNVP